ncbi:MAG: hypothetical protein HC796_09700 [Synechococcaceae cyanobacterium RL_1_2]|nr:hypothetical protein [Synechococcaceae cyanobacterium RL_1_2]
MFNAGYNDPVFVYEVVGLNAADKGSSLDYSIRKSGSVFFKVPLSRMNQEMRRISKLGGRIVSIQRAGEGNAAQTSTPAAPPKKL